MFGDNFFTQGILIIKCKLFNLLLVNFYSNKFLSNIFKKPNNTIALLKGIRLFWGN